MSREVRFPLNRCHRVLFSIEGPDSSLSEDDWSQLMRIMEVMKAGFVEPASLQIDHITPMGNSLKEVVEKVQTEVNRPKKRGDRQLKKIDKPKGGLTKRGFPERVRAYVKGQLEKGLTVSMIIEMVKEEFSLPISDGTIWNWKKQWFGNEMPSAETIKKEKEATKAAARPVEPRPVPSQDVKAKFSKEVYDWVKGTVIRIRSGGELKWNNSQQLARTNENIARVADEKFGLNGALTAEKVGEWIYAMQKAGDLEILHDKPGRG